MELETHKRASPSLTLSFSLSCTSFLTPPFSPASPAFPLPRDPLAFSTSHSNFAPHCSQAPLLIFFLHISPFLPPLSSYLYILFLPRAVFQERTGIAGKTGRRCWDGGGGWGTGYVNWNAWGRMDGRGRRWKGCPDSEAPETLNINTFSHLCPFSDIHWLGSLRVDRDTHTHPPSLALPLSPNWVPTENERQQGGDILL